MAEFIVNLILILAVLMLLATWALSARRHRRRDRRANAAERRLILAALTNTATTPTVPAATGDHVQPSNAHGADPQPNPPTTPERLDTTSISALLELLEDRQPAARGILASLVASPRTVWAAGTRAGQTLRQRTTVNQTENRTDEALDGAIYRAAAAELVNIHAHDPSDAQREYHRYVTAVGDHALAEMYVRSATYARVSPEQAPQIVNDITAAKTS